MRFMRWQETPVRLDAKRWPEPTAYTGYVLVIIASFMRYTMIYWW